ncbi:hypothetical protein CXG81DRAFT_20506 [Caulochytrium protostelioides]|uniref:Secreted protein n=1 Tax=Caulochytrium protostelioides TaxID=1555241 RepID=A0A4P9X319_9FUNG|nr:hypothetical protein CXG81DRAFT_20506 [Caulochytrium protostelioides]|eukprot:RKO99394.1 hypothetical protein CXG81DRAFT_20506 [Caulochytrium protostelioides]
MKIVPGTFVLALLVLCLRPAASSPVKDAHVSRQAWSRISEQRLHYNNGAPRTYDSIRTKVLRNANAPIQNVERLDPGNDGYRNKKPTPPATEMDDALNFPGGKWRKNLRQSSPKPAAERGSTAGKHSAIATAQTAPPPTYAQVARNIKPSHVVL